MIDFSEIQRRITNGISVEELEARLRPQEYEMKEGKWSDTSRGGFLAPNESLLGVVRADYDTLRSLGKTYEQMAQLAANFLEQVGKGYKGGTNFTLMRMDTMGLQSCPWGCNGRDEYEYRTSGSGHVYVVEKGNETSDLMKKHFQIQREASQMEFPELDFNEAQEARRKVLQERERSIGIDFGGMFRVSYLSAVTVITDLTPHLIASHYFFEGDSSYRTDPKKLLQVTGTE